MVILILCITFLISGYIMSLFHFFPSFWINTGLLVLLVILTEYHSSCINNFKGIQNSE